MTNNEMVREAGRLIVAKHAEINGYDMPETREVTHDDGTFLVWDAPEGALQIQLDLQDA